MKETSLRPKFRRFGGEIEISLHCINVTRLDTSLLPISLLGTSADREIQRTLMELLTQLDGFDDLGKVKLIMATNRPVRTQIP